MSCEICWLLEGEAMEEELEDMVDIPWPKQVSL